MPQGAYTPYEDLDLANQISRKLGVSDRKLEGRSPYSIVILIHITHRGPILSEISIFH